jgi:hypothetical protein
VLAIIAAAVSYLASSEFGGSSPLLPRAAFRLRGLPQKARCSDTSCCENVKANQQFHKHDFATSQSHCWHGPVFT